MFRYIKQLHNQLPKQSTKKFMIENISSRLLRLEFKPDNRLKSKAVKHIVKNMLPDYKKGCLILFKQPYIK